MKVLLVGGGGREHALGWKIAQSPVLERLYVAPGNPGLNRLGEQTGLAESDTDGIVRFACEEKIDLVVVGPEAPLAAGLADRLHAAGILCFGPSAAAARLESSKAFAKEICAVVGAPTAPYRTFSAAAAAKAHLAELSPPYVIKADGLAAGKGVVIAQTRAAAESAVDAALADGGRIVVEAFLEGEEASFFALCDGERAVPLCAAQDHKRAFDGDRGPNTGGMGAYAPAPIITAAVEKRVMDNIVDPVLREMRRRGTPYRGALFVGLMIKDDEPSVVEFNARFGDPETQVIVRLLQSDILPLLRAAANGALDEAAAPAWRPGAAACVVLATKGYPGSYQKGSIIRGVDAADGASGTVVFHAGTALRDGALTATGGRVLNVTATGADIGEAVNRAYAGVDRIDWPEGFCRRDIGWRAVGDQARDPETSEPATAQGDATR